MNQPMYGPPADSGQGLFARRAIAQSFGTAAASYDEHAELQRKVADRLLDMAGEPGREASILDLGSGSGYCSTRLSPLIPGGTLCALDLALPMLSLPAYMDQRISRICADAEALPLAAASIDLVLSSLTIQWCRDLPALFAELKRILKPGGRILLSTFGPASLREVREAWARVDSYTHVNTFVAPDELLRHARKTGLHCTMQRELHCAYVASLYELSRSLKGIGAHNMNRAQARGLTTPGRFRKAAEQFAAGSEAGGLIPVTWEICYLDLKHG